MIIFEGDKLFLEVFENDGFEKKFFDNGDSLIYYYTESCYVEGETTLKNLFWAFINDKNSKALSSTLKSLTGEDLFLKYIEEKIKNGSKGSFNEVDWLEISPIPKITSDVDHSKEIEAFEENWSVEGFLEGDTVEKINITAMPVEALLNAPVYINPNILVYDKNGNEITNFYQIPSVSDVLESLCYEFYYYRENFNETEETAKFINIEDLEK